MEKIVGLLSETTILDIQKIYVLALRYKIHFTVAVILFLCVFSFQYFTQPIIYAVRIPVKAAMNHTVSTDLSALLPVENGSMINLEELNITLSNLSFLKNLANTIILDPAFLELNFGNIRSREPILGKSLKRSCGNDKDCLVNNLAQSLKELFYVEQGVTADRFILVTNAIDKKTAHFLAGFLSKTIELDRVKIRQYTVHKEIKGVTNLIEESRTMMQLMGGYAALEEQEKLQNNISDLRERIRMLQATSSMEMANSTALHARVAQNRKSTNNSKSSAPEHYETFLKAQIRLNEIKLNITTLSLIPDEKRSASDRLILSQLMSEQVHLAKMLPSSHSLRSMVLDEDFKEKQRVNSGDFEFDYQVSKNKILKLQADYENSKLELNDFMQKKLANESKVNGMRADLDFLKSLEAKLMSLKLLNATMTSDLIFEGGNQEVEEFRRSPAYKLLFFSFSMTFLFYIVSILIRYSNDDKIYGESDVRLYLKKLDFIGEVPSFEKNSI